MDRKKKILTFSLIGVLFMSVLVGAFLLTKSKQNNNDVLKIDENVIVGEINNQTLEERLKEAQEKVDEGRLAIDMAPNPIFNDGKSEGKVMIGNPSNNTKNFTVEFVLDDTNESVYKSGLIPPNGYIKTAVLNKNLEKGEYPAVAYFTSYNSDGVADGTVGLNIQITILN